MDSKEYKYEMDTLKHRMLEYMKTTLENIKDNEIVFPKEAWRDVAIDIPWIDNPYLMKACGLELINGEVYLKAESEDGADAGCTAEDVSAEFLERLARTMEGCI